MNIEINNIINKNLKRFEVFFFILHFFIIYYMKVCPEVKRGLSN